MPGTPKKRERTEKAKLNGEVTTPVTAPPETTPQRVMEEKEIETADGEKVMVMLPALPPQTPRADGKKGADPEYMRILVERRQILKKYNRKRYGEGRQKENFTREDKEKFALDKLMPKAFAVLEEQLDSKDERVRQAAAIRVMEYVKGRPTQTIKTEGEQVHTIRYETVAFDHVPNHDLELNDSEVMELEAGG